MPTRQVVYESCNRHSTFHVVSAVSTEELQRACNNPYQLLNMSGGLKVVTSNTYSKIREVTYTSHTRTAYVTWRNIRALCLLWFWVWIPS